MTSVEQIGPREWILRTAVPDTGMSNARISSLDAAADHVGSILEVAPDAAQRDYLEKVLIVDEEITDGTYQAMLRVLSSRDDPEFAASQRRDTDFDSGSVPDALRPEWVMVVPASVSSDGAWDIARRNSTWASKWNIPFRDGATQFLPASFDADDRAVSDRSRDFDVLTDHLSDRYNADHILYVARSDNGEILLSHWSDANAWMGTISAGDGIDISNYTNLRAAVLDGFWSTYGDAVRQPSATGSEHSDRTGQADTSNGRATRYRLVGQPAADGGTIDGFLQVIDDGAITTRDLQSKIQAVQGLTLASVEDHGSSFLVQFSWRGGTLPGLEQALANAGFSSDLY
ncbi:hypothetical protein [Salipiger mucosus]|nr:hypothetical protein [Salipiger mucosus]